MGSPRTLCCACSYIVLLGACSLTSSGSGDTAGDDNRSRPTIAAKTRTMRALPGFVPLYWDERAGKMWLEIAHFGQDLLYVDSLPAGLGSNDIGLDRGKLGRDRVVRFERSGPRVLFVQQNLAFRAEHGTATEKAAVQDAFAQSVLAGFEVAAEENGRVLVDATTFFLSDAHGVAGTLRRSSQGTYTLDAARCAFDLTHTRNFPSNTEVEVTLTFAGNEPGSLVRDVAADPQAITVRTRHSLIALPGPGYEPRVFDPSSGYFSFTYADYSVPIDKPIEQRFITRHRLHKVDPNAARSKVVEPIVYYLDPATPEPIRGALLDGARWWAEAFDAAGFVDAYRVEMLPEGADKMDVRYNVIQWVHRSTRGWSYGSSISDPRTGEILKGHVSLGSLRVRQDHLIARGLLAPFETGKPVAPELEAMALARLRQLSAHEIGHTLGLAHNYIASTANRASVMDYPAPFVQLRRDGSIDLGDAYATGIGAWDKVSIAYGYSQFAPGADEKRELTSILVAARARGLTFLTDQDGRPAGSPHPATHLWDNGQNAPDELQRVLDVRAAALARFGENAIEPGQPIATLEEALVPLYLMHRYQIEAAAKSVGGLAYTYALRGDGQVPTQAVAPAEQRRALAALLDALAPARLQLPEALLAQIPPRPAGFDRHRELFANRTSAAFDALAPAEALADLTFSLLLHSGRCARLVEQHARDENMLGLAEMLAAVVDATWKHPAGGDHAGEIQRTVDYAALAHLVRLASNANATGQVRALTTAQLVQLRDWLLAARSDVPAQQAHLAHGARLIATYLEHPTEFVPPRLDEAPPGAPIGCDW
ncbi:MAG: zinc-dependent metalloprotease [Planctomycetota bacterium]